MSDCALRHRASGRLRRVAARTPALAKSIEGLWLRSTASREACVAFCETAAALHVAAICVAPTHVRAAAEALAGTDVRVVALISHPFGADRPEVKALACALACEDGADDVEVVVDLARFRDGDPNHVRDELRRCRAALPGGGRVPTVRAVIDTAAYDDRHLRLLGRAVLAGGADMVVTSSGLAPEPEGSLDIELLREEVGTEVGVKAVRGARTVDEIRQLLAAGASRVGTTHLDDLVGTVR